MTNIERIKYELSVQLHCEQCYDEIEEKLPTFEKIVRSNSHFWVILEIVSHVDEM